MNKKNLKAFNAAEVPLQGSNLIEASAGTGKTYSIAILVLRLVLEQELSIKEILMVTFTKAAVAELEERIRLFIRGAYKSALGKTINDNNIVKLVRQAVERSGEAPVRQQLKDAVLFLDETSVLTIHSFCQQTLNEFAFETRQLFGAEMMPDAGPVIEAELNKFWRRQVTTLPAALLERIWKEDMRAGIQQLLKEHISGKKYLGYHEEGSYAISGTVQEEWLKELSILEQKEAEIQSSLELYVKKNRANLIADTSANTHARNKILPLIDSPVDLLDFIWDNRDKAKYIQNVYGELLTKIEERAKAAQERERLILFIRQRVYNLAIREVGEGVRAIKDSNNLLGYDDLIGNLHDALVKRENPKLAEELQKKYKAVFVDEFQDTDRQQFEIFDKAFGENTILFYIGDPKQSIYAWRKADIFTYFKARNGVQHLYGMNHNYRSSASLIEAMNQFFLPEEGFDTFYFGRDGDAIGYMPVESPSPDTKGFLCKGIEADPPISIIRCTKNDELVEAVAAQTACLLQNGAYSVSGKGVSRTLTPSDIGILVRTGKQGSEVKAALAKLGIPAVTLDDSKVLQSDEASSLLYLMEAVAAPDRSSINRALLSTFTGLGAADILRLDDEEALGLFTKYKNRWQQDGIYTALMDFVADFGVRNILLQSAAGNGERIITNLFQLIELIHQVESRKNLSMVELISWLKRGIDGMATEGDEYALRVESDEDAVTIVTIHKSKGLEYNVVLAPFLDFVENGRQDFLSFRDPLTGDYIGAERDRLSQEQNALYQQQAEQENRRLLYVAITRAVYKCYIFRNESSPNRNSTLAGFVNLLAAKESSLEPFIRFEKGRPLAPETRYRAAGMLPAFVHQEPVNFILREENWRKMSYTMLAAKTDQGSRGRSFPQADPYDSFVFHTLRRGAKTGNFLHFIFENINFSDDSRWDKWLKEGVRRFVPGQQELYLPMLRQMLQYVLHTAISIDGVKFPLASVAWNKRIAEFEFDFPMPLFNPDVLNALSDEELSVNIRSFHEFSNGELEGIMNGKMDLFFEQGGRYYILDWKSNWLGADSLDYSPEALAEAMNQNNYHLQYLLYTLAATKYLETRIAGFDYERQFGGVIYLFVRGIRSGTQNGIFTRKPSPEKLRELERILKGSGADT